MDNSLDIIACASITTQNRDFFYLQQKDENHPVQALRLKYAFFGGKAEGNESAHDAMLRELNEELFPEAVALIVPHLNVESLFAIKLQRMYLLPKQDYCMLHFYEVKLSLRDICAIESLPIKEGKRGIILPRSKWSESYFP